MTLTKPKTFPCGCWLQDIVDQREVVYDCSLQFCDLHAQAEAYRIQLRKFCIWFEEMANMHTQEAASHLIKETREIIGP